MTTSQMTARDIAWPAEAAGLFAAAQVCTYASLTRDGRPISWPVTPYVGARGTLDVTTGLTYPDKAERARRDPRVALLFASADAAESADAPTVLVEGFATVRDADLQAGADRYVRESLARSDAGFAGVPWFVVKRMAWYFARIWVEITPLRILSWPGGDLSAVPDVWSYTETIAVPESDPAPSGPRQPSRSAPPADWRPFADRAHRLGTPVVTMVVDGSPLPVPTRSAIRTRAGFELQLPAGIEAVDGPVCLTFHQHGDAMEWQENVVLVGSARGAGPHLTVRVDRALNDWSLTGNPLQRNLSFLREGEVLRKRLAAEAARRGQPVPKVRRPGD